MTTDINHLIEQLDPSVIPQPLPITSTVFGEVLAHDGNIVSLDEIADGPGEAQYADSDATLTARELASHTTKTITPAYLQVKTNIKPTSFTTRSYNEQINGSMSSADRLLAAQVNESLKHKQAIFNSLEKVALNLLTAGSFSLAHTTTSGTDRVISADFSRDSKLSFGTSGAWNSKSNNPLDDIEKAANAMIAAENGGAPHTIIMSPDRWSAFSKHTLIKDRFNKDTTQQGTLNVDTRYRNEMVYQGTLDGMAVYVARFAIQATDGKSSRVLPDNKVVLLGDVNGVRVHCPVLHVDSMLPVESYSWTWKTEAGQNCVRTASHAILVPRKINRTALITC